MKKSFFLLVFLFLSAFVFAQEVESPDFVSSTVTSGTILTEHDMAGFQQTSNALSQGFSKDQRIAIAGWSLFAASFPVAAVGAWIIVEGEDAVKPKTNNPTEWVATGIADFGIVGVGVCLVTLSCAAMISGIVCLGVSYSRMGGHANLTDTGLRERKPLVTYNLQSSRDGLGFAIRF